MKQPETSADLKTRFEALYRENVDRIHAYIMRRVGDRELAHDITQKVFLRAYEALPRYKNEGKPYAAFLFRIASNELVNEWRSRGKMKMEELEESHAVTEGKEPELDADEAKKMLAPHLPALSEDFRLVLELRYFAHLEPAEIGTMTGWSTNKVGVIHHRALRKLESLMTR